MIRSIWNLGQAAAAISLFLTVTGASITRAADDVQLVECRTDGSTAAGSWHGPHNYGVAGDGTVGLGPACPNCRAHGLAACPHGAPDDGSRRDYRQARRQGYVDGLYEDGLGRAGRRGRGGYWCDDCQAWHRGHGGNGGRGDLCDGRFGGRGDCRNGDCRNGNCRNGNCRNGHCLGGGCYRPVEGYYNDPRDSEVYSAVGYNVPVSVPLPPTVRYQYQYGWGLPSSRLVQVGNTYTQYYPQQQFTQSGGRLAGGPPVIYQPIDTTQMGFYSVHAPRWVPVKRINSIQYNYGW